MVAKFETENLKCVAMYDKRRDRHFAIFEKGEVEKLVVIYYNPHKMEMSCEIPVEADKYKYFKELYEIIELLVKMDNAV